MWLMGYQLATYKFAFGTKTTSGYPAPLPKGWAFTIEDNLS